MAGLQLSARSAGYATPFLVQGTALLLHKWLQLSARPAPYPVTFLV